MTQQNPVFSLAKSYLHSLFYRDDAIGNFEELVNDEDIDYFVECCNVMHEYLQVFALAEPQKPIEISYIENMDFDKNTIEPAHIQNQSVEIPMAIFTTKMMLLKVRTLPSFYARETNSQCYKQLMRVVIANLHTLFDVFDLPQSSSVSASGGGGRRRQTRRNTQKKARNGRRRK